MFSLIRDLIQELEYRLSSPRIRESIIWLIVSQVFLFPLWVSVRFNLFFLLERAADAPLPFILSALTILFPILFTQIFGQLPLQSLRHTVRRTSRIELGPTTTITFDETHIPEGVAVSRSIDKSYDIKPPRNVDDATDIAISGDLTLAAFSNINKISIDSVDPRQLLHSYIKQSAAIADRIYKRSGVYLFTGVIISFVGLGVFYLRTKDVPNDISILDHALLLLPGAGILFFIEFVALFFLRLHRTAMDEFRYFDSLRRGREESLVALKMFAENSTVVSAKEVLQSINIYSGPVKIGKDETIDILESKRLQKDEIVILEKLVDALSVVRGKEEKRSEKK
jgi:hypothetical protein